MTSRCAVAAFTAAVTCLALGAQAEVPELIEDPGGGPPIWMTADAARNPDGSLQWEHFPSSMREDLKQRIQVNQQLRSERTDPLEAAPAACQTVRLSTSGLGLPDTRFATFLEYSELAFTGRVRDVAEGFYHGQVAALIEVQVERVIEKPEALGAPSTIYVRFGQAEVEAEGEMLCVRNDHYPDRPTIGGRILVFADAVTDEQPPIVNPHSMAVLFEREDGSVSLGWERGPFVGKGPTWASVEKELYLAINEEVPGGTQPREEGR